jgi:hypothetical protein
MTMVKTVRNLLGLAFPREQGRRQSATVLALLVLPVVWLVSTTAVVSAQEKKPANEAKAVAERAASPAYSKYTATATLLVHFQPPATAVVAQEWTRERFEIYRATQGQLLVSRRVLLAALRNQQVAKLPVIRREQTTGDPVEWLKRRVRVAFPGNAEIMEVGLTADDAQEAATLLRAVVEAYLDEFVNTESDKKPQRLREVDRAVAEKEREVRLRREALKKLAAELGTSSAETLALKQKLLLEGLAMYRKELARVQGELRKLRSELASKQALLKSIDKIGIADPEVDRMMQSDPVGRELFVELGWKRLDQLYMDTAIVKGASSLYVDRYQQALKTLQESYNARKAELLAKRRSLVQAEVRKLESSLATLAEQERMLQALVDAKQREANRFGNSVVDMEMLLSDIRNAELVLNQLASERDKLRAECRAAPRIELIDPPCMPVAPDD